MDYFNNNEIFNVVENESSLQQDFPFTDEDYSRFNTTTDAVLPSVFVKIPLQQPTNSREIKSEPIKSESAALQQQQMKQMTLPLVIARPKQTPVKCFKCSQCPFISISQAGLDAHCCTTHNENTQNTRHTRKLTCPGCDNVFYTEKSLEAHLSNDHQMSQNEILVLVNSLVTPEDDVNVLTNKIYLKNVDNLKIPSNVETNLLVNHSDFIDLIDEDVSVLQLPERFQKRIYLRNVDYLRKFDYHDYENAKGLSQSFNFQSVEEEQQIQLHPETPRKPNRIFIKNVDILKEPLIVDDNATPSPPIGPIPVQYNDETSDFRLNTNLVTQMEVDTEFSSETSLPPFNRICEDFPDQFHQLESKNTQEENSRKNSLHLRTVDELNLLNVQDVQNLISTNTNHGDIFASNQQNDNSQVDVNQNTNDDVIILKDYSQMIGYSYYSSNETIQVIEDLMELDCANHAGDQIGDVAENQNTFQVPNETKSQDDFANILAHNIIPNEPLDEEDIRFVCAEEMINETDPQFNGKSLDTVPLETTTEPSPSKARIYVSSNLTLPDNGAKKIRGRPKGSRRSGVATTEKRTGLKEADGLEKCNFSGCCYRFKSDKLLSYHKKCHTHWGITCPECARTDFNDWNTLHTHLWREHQIDMELFSCDKCDFKTPVQSRLVNTHMRIHSDERNYKCNTCDKSFKNAKQLKNHKHRMHRKRAEPMQRPQEVKQCSECESTFLTQRRLREHFANAHEKRPEYQCQQCGQTFSTKSGKETHMKKHNDNYDLKCVDCKYCTYDKNAMRRHHLKHTGGSLYKCPICGYSCIQSTTYKYHMTSQHPERCADFVYKCSACSYVTVNRKKYEVHFFRHSSNPPGEVTVVKSVTKTSADDNAQGSAKTFEAGKLSQGSTIKVKSNLLLTSVLPVGLMQ